MRVIPAFAVAVLLSVSSAAYAADETAPAPAASEAQAEKPKKICRTERATGSVMPKRVCRTPEQVAAEEQAAQRTREQMQRR